jgi:hypothetical protein
MGVLKLSRSQIATLSNDAEIVRQIERLISLVNNTARGDAVVVDEALDASGRTLTVQLGIGRHFVDLVVMVDVKGGGPGDGYVVEDAGSANAATLKAGSLALVGGDGSSVVAYNAPTPGPYAFGSGTGNTVFLRGFVDVVVSGAFGFLIKVQGSPTSALLLAGSGLTASILREA